MSQDPVPESPSPRAVTDDRLELLVLARLGAKKKRPTARALGADTRRFAPAALDDVAWGRAVEAALDRLRAAGRLDAAGLAPGGPDEVRRRLGLAAALPWKAIVQRVLPALGLGLAAGAAGKAVPQGREGWAAAIVAQTQGLWAGGPPPSVARVCDQIIWRALGLRGAPRPMPNEVRALFVNQLVGPGEGPPARRVALLAALAVGASRPDLGALRDALVRRWLQGAAPGDGDLGRVVAAVRAVAAQVQGGRFGERKVFIAALWRAGQGDPVLGRLTLAELKARLVEAHRAGLLELTRADLAGAMEPALVAESETVHEEARYHFVTDATVA